MKTTVKLNSCSTITVQPTKAGTLLIEVESGGQIMACFCMTLDQWNAMMFGGEMAIEAALVSSGCSASMAA